MCFYMIKTTSLSSVNELRKELFLQKNKTMEAIPPTQIRI